MAKQSTGEKLVLAGIVGFLGALVVVGFAGLMLGVYACLAMLLMNVLLPLFGVEYPLTWIQAFGAAGILAIVRAIVGSMISVNTKQ